MVKTGGLRGNHPIDQASDPKRIKTERSDRETPSEWLPETRTRLGTARRHGTGRI